MKHPYAVAHEYGEGFFVTKRVVGGKFSPYYNTATRAELEAARLNSLDAEYLLKCALELGRDDVQVLRDALNDFLQVRS